MKLVIRQGHLLCPVNNLNEVADLFIEEDRILATHQAPDGFTPDQEINAESLMVSPGFIDLGSQLREPGFEHKATISSETEAASKGGYTTVCCFPETQPVIDTPAIAEFIQQRAQEAGFCKVYPFGALTERLKGEQLSGYHALKEAGCIALSQGHQPIYNTRVLRHCLEYAATHQMTVFMHALEPWLNNPTGIDESAMQLNLGLPGIPACSEQIELARILNLVALTGAQVHFCRLTSAHSLPLLQQAREQGCRVTADVALSHLVYTHDQLAEFNSQYHVNPPLRHARDRDALRHGLQQGVLQAIAANHEPHEHDATWAPFCESAAGMSTFESVLPLALQCVSENAFSLMDLIRYLSTNPAEILGLSAEQGSLSVNSKADLCLFSPDKSWVVNQDTWRSRGENTPVWQQTLKGQVIHTIQNGRLVLK